MIEHRLARRLALEHDLHHALQECEVAADLDMHELAADLGRAEGRHLDDVLRLGEFDQRAFGHRVDRDDRHPALPRSEEHTSELQSLMRISYAVFCLKKKTKETEHESTCD